MSEIRGDHIGSTVSRVDGSSWRVVVHWHRVGGQLVPAGVEVRSYGVEGEDETDFQGGQETPDHSHPELEDGERSRGVSSELLARRVKWGQVLGEHASEFSRMLDESANETATLHAGSAAFMREVSGLASGLTRATNDTYRLVAELHRQALTGLDRSRPGVYVLRRLADEHGYQLDPDVQSDRVKVRQWIAEARRRGYLPPAERKGSK